MNPARLGAALLLLAVGLSSCSGEAQEEAAPGAAAERRQEAAGQMVRAGLLEELAVVLGKATSAAVEETRSAATLGAADGPIYVDFAKVGRSKGRLRYFSENPAASSDEAAEAAESGALPGPPFDRQAFASAFPPEMRGRLRNVNGFETAWETRTDSPGRRERVIARDGIIVNIRGVMPAGAGAEAEAGGYVVSIETAYNDGDEYKGVPSRQTEVTLRKQGGRWTVTDIRSSEVIA